MARMGIISRQVDKLPAWAQLVLTALSVAGGIYGIAHYGFWHFMLRMILSPDF
jgi:hypothetical protein